MVNRGHAYYSMEMPNVKLVRQGLENFAKAPLEVGRKGMLRLAQRVSAHYAYTKSNPPRHAAYVRTLAMRKSRQILAEEYGYVFVMNPAGKGGRPYAGYVVGDMTPNSQAWMHQGIWIPLLEAVTTEVAKMPPEIIKELGMALAVETAKANKK